MLTTYSDYQFFETDPVPEDNTAVAVGVSITVILIVIIAVAVAVVVAYILWRFTLY